MLKKLRGLLGGAAASAATTASAGLPKEHALLRQIAERSTDDPLIGAKMGSREVTQRLLTALHGERGIPIESALCALGALAGYSCQASVRALAVARGLPETAHLVAVDTRGGQRYFFGDAINKPLAESQYSVWGLVAGAAQQAGCTQVLDVGEIFRHAAETVGSDAFGRPRVPQQHLPHELPINYLRQLWPVLLPTIRKFCPDPEHWPVLLSLSIQVVLHSGKDVLDPCLARRLVMESAIPMSRENLASSDSRW